MVYRDTMMGFTASRNAHCSDIPLYGIFVTLRRARQQQAKAVRDYGSMRRQQILQTDAILEIASSAGRPGSVSRESGGRLQVFLAKTGGVEIQQLDNWTQRRQHSKLCSWRPTDKCRVRWPRCDRPARWMAVVEMRRRSSVEGK
jgi:hypothetical protein